MIPILYIALLAILGLFVWGFKGLILGAVVGYVSSILFGRILILLSGGILPRKVRRDTAMNFIASHPDLVRATFPEIDETRLLRAIERVVDSIFRRAAMDNKSINQNFAFTRAAIRDATCSLVDEEPNPKMTELLLSLLDLIERDMYL